MVAWTIFMKSAMIARLVAPDQAPDNQIEDLTDKAESYI